ncbi:hypothetical protein GLOTRDRAFT_123437 [Gloeophyllum trabeum ATCC 11539]|uniref:Uncharacterized protein n=1 Tax=Gloeophyllum trabeum (strain ATCC 11539 / FP-39264 / Madison 617) TaxID=670483 RepID=S7PSU1_GLOTA|nr:uncharacterized protein GLOTRDRAFT_123437 [Gloeophyllum trabeum ATCC 11539]EPQ50881.1 hypothetical protein GLOTRDRAFT_123437 [Gloeophyllum trabeum ATCC 11539]
MPLQKALLIAIDYRGKDALVGPGHGVYELKELLLGSAKLATTKKKQHFAGHASQEPADNDPNEEDGQDEGRYIFWSFVIRRSEHLEELLAEDGLPIRDNDLRALLVDPLPAGSSLVVKLLFYGMYSLLISSGIWNKDLEHYHCNAPWNPARKTSPIVLRHHPAPDSRPSFLHRRSSSSSSLGRRMSWASPPAINTEDSWTRIICTGDCPQIDNEVANVVSISACMDSQLCWEDSAGNSITHVLVNYLRNNPDSTLYEVVLELSRKLQRVGWEVERQQSIEGDPMNPGQVYQLPQIGSHCTLDLDSPFIL